jgi:DNA-binding transcriptional regulator YiaG
MPNFNQALKAEVVRIARKEIKSTVNSIRSSTIVLKKTSVNLKKRVAFLEAENKRLLSNQKSIKQEPLASPETKAKVRLTSKGIRQLREKLGLSQGDLAALIGISNQAVHAMEHKEGKLKLRPSNLVKVLAIRKLGKREIQKALEEAGKRK